jgi:hypothetical protein
LFSGPVHSLAKEASEIRSGTALQFKGMLISRALYVHWNTRCRNLIQLFSIHSPASKTPVGELLGHFLDVLRERKYAQ